MYRFSPSSFQDLLILGHQQGLEISLRVPDTSGFGMTK